MLFKLAQSAEKGWRHWRKLRGHDHFPDLLQGKKFIDGLSEAEHQAQKSKSTTPQTAA